MMCLAELERDVRDGLLMSISGISVDNHFNSPIS